jgi:hypothetical protein
MTSTDTIPAARLNEPLTEYDLVQFLEYVKQSTTQAMTVFAIPGLNRSALRREMEDEMKYLGEMSARLVAEVRAARRERNETDLSALADWPIAHWQDNLDADESYLNCVVQFGPLRQFIRAIAEQRTDKPSFSKVCKTSAIQDFEVGYCCGELGKAGITIRWAE